MKLLNPMQAKRLSQRISKRRKAVRAKAQPHSARHSDPPWHKVEIIDPEMRGGTAEGYLELKARNRRGQTVLGVLTIHEALAGSHKPRRRLSRNDLPF